MSHIKSQLFSLIGRKVRIIDPIQSCKEFGVIVSKEEGMRFGVAYGDTVHYYDRSEFILPPLRRGERWPIYLEDDYDGFVYSDVENF